MMSLDLVISVDTATAHLAGGLGVPVWVPLSAIGEWRWLLDRQDSPWYPTMRLFRQRKLGRWRSVFQRMARELRNVRLSDWPAVNDRVRTGSTLARPASKGLAGASV